MLSQIRNLSRGAVAAIILGGVGLSMVLFLPQGNIQIGARQDLVRVRNLTITPPQLAREMEVTLERLRNQGVNMSQQDAIDQGGHLQLLEDMTVRRAINAFADKIGVSASDGQVGELVRRIPAVLNPITGQVDETAYRQFLAQRRYSEAEFINDVRGDMTTQMLMQAMVSGTRAPSSYGAINLAFETETRTISIAEASAATIGAIPQPNDAQIQAFYEDNAERLRIPEFRTLTLTYARLSDFMARVQLPEAQLREEFASRSASLSTPERRTYLRLTAPNEQQANQAVTRLNRGEDVDTVAQDLGLQAARAEDQTRREVPDAQVAEAVFSMAARAPARAVRGRLTPWVVVRVDSVTPAVVPTFESARQQLHDELAREEAGDLLNAAISTFEDARAGGASLADAARQANLPSVTIPAVDEHGHDRNDAEIPALAGATELVETAFQTQEGEASDFMPIGDADVMVGVDRIIPSTVRPLAEVRTELVGAWLQQERLRRLRELGQEIVQAVAGGQDFAAAVRQRNLRMVVRSQPINRRAAAEQIPARGLAGMIFSAREGQAVSDVRVDGNAIFVAAVEGIHRVDPNENPQLLEAARGQAQEALVSSVGETLRDEIVAWAKPDRNDALIEQLYRPSNAQTDEEAP